MQVDISSFLRFFKVLCGCGGAWFGVGDGEFRDLRDDDQPTNLRFLPAGFSDSVDVIV
jgi:hypothetical protein